MVSKKWLKEIRSHDFLSDCLDEIYKKMSFSKFYLSKEEAFHDVYGIVSDVNKQRRKRGFTPYYPSGSIANITKMFTEDLFEETDKGYRLVKLK